MKRNKSSLDFETTEEWDAYETEMEAQRRRLQPELKNNQFQAMHPPVTAIKFDGTDANMDLIAALCYPLQLSIEHKNDRCQCVIPYAGPCGANIIIYLGEYIVKENVPAALSSRCYTVTEEQFEQCYYPFPIDKKATT